MSTVDTPNPQNVLLAGDQQDSSPAGLVRGYLRRLASGDIGSLPIIIGMVFIAIIFQRANANFLTPRNFVNLITQLAGTTMIAYGVVFVLLLGEIDLSIGYVSAVCGVAVAILLRPPIKGQDIFWLFPYLFVVIVTDLLWMAFISVRKRRGHKPRWLIRPRLVLLLIDIGVIAVAISLASVGWQWYTAILVALLAVAGIGLLQGLIITLFHVPSFIVTLAGLLAWNGVVLHEIGNGGTVIIQDPVINGVANSFLAPTLMINVNDVYPATQGWISLVLAVIFVVVCLVIWFAVYQRSVEVEAPNVTSATSSASGSKGLSSAASDSPFMINLRQTASRFDLELPSSRTFTLQVAFLLIGAVVVFILGNVIANLSLIVTVTALVIIAYVVYAALEVWQYMRQQQAGKETRLLDLLMRLLIPLVVIVVVGVVYQADDGVPAGWAVAAIFLIGYAAAQFSRYDSRRRKGLKTRPIILMVIELLVLTIIAAVFVLVCNQDRGVPVVGVILLVALVVLTYLARSTPFGRYVYAVGGNAEAARRAGINVTRIRVIVFIMSSTLAGLGGIILASRLRSVDTNAGSGNLLLDAIAAAVIGGTSLFGGRGFVASAVLGALVISSVENGLGLLNLSSGDKFIITGIVLLIAVVVDALSRRRQQQAGIA